MNIETFKSQDFGNLRVITMDGVLWMVGTDVAEGIGYVSPRKALIDHVETEDKTMSKHIAKNGAKVTLINESGLFSLISASRMPGASQYKHWVLSEVLPSIRCLDGRVVSEDLESDTEEGGGEVVRSSEENGIPVDRVIECARIMANCPPENRAYAAAILRHCFPEIEDIVGNVEPKTHVPATLTSAQIAACVAGARDPVLVDRQKPDMEGAEKRREQAAVRFAGCKRAFDTERFRRTVTKSELKRQSIIMRVGCAESTFEKWMKGISKPSTYYRTQLCCVLGVPAGFFDKPGEKKGEC